MHCLLDTNILLRAVDRNHPKCRPARRAIINLHRQHNRLFLTPQNLIEFWAVATRPVDSNGLGMSVQVGFGAANQDEAILYARYGYRRGFCPMGASCHTTRGFGEEDT